MCQCELCNLLLLILSTTAIVLAEGIESSYLNRYASVPAPRLECGSDGIRLHVTPSGPFGGHVYVRGFFPQTVCHLDYCTQFTSSPFTMELPFRGPCNVRRRRNVSPPSISYDVTVIIQHHPLFVTSYDKAYRLNCIYKQRDALVQQKLNVSDINPIQIENKSTPRCRYDVLSGSLHGPIIKFANVGDTVVHKWSCDSGDMFGFLVHSCSVRDQAGSDFQFVDERGCVTDKSLFPEITYSPDMNSAFTIIKAFRYADQVMVHFSCQITVCKKSEQGCEGITPPVCRPLDFGPIRVQYPNDKNRQENSSERGRNEFPTAPPTLPPRNSQYQTARPSTSSPLSSSTTTTTSTTSAIPTTQKFSDVEKISGSSKFSSPNSYDFPNFLPETNPGDLDATVGIKVTPADTNNYGLEISNVDDNTSTTKRSLQPIIGEPEKNGFRTEVLSQTMDNVEPFPFPKKAEIFQASRAHRSRRKTRNEPNITLEVESTQVLLLGNDEIGANFNEPERQQSVFKNPVKCNAEIGKTFAMSTLIVMQIFSIFVIVLQRYLYQKSIDKLM
ncbi:unnamed protein product [Caenorhabditis bovis]|uniref:ZP domain-containing protein n=1 Tax=Caenorhabditis bovis TaxID=2654633 RepID=A0A8S1F2G9_9PELO|nr:unnamed protein product [Caenorhabditis bovis]